jgi:polyisoprenoid-binding protein YceI
MTVTASPVATRTFTIDKAHSEAAFQVRHLITKVRGRFEEFSGTIQFNGDQPEASSVALSIAAASIDTATPDRDAHLRSEDFFFVEKYPTIDFTSSQITRKSDGSFAVRGTLTIRGVARDVVVPVSYLGEARDPWGQTRIGFEAETTVNRKDFGLTWNAALETGGFLVGDEVTISLAIQALAR